MKKWILLLILLLSMPIVAHAKTDNNFNDYYKDQMKNFNVDKAKNNLPKGTLKALKSIGIENLTPQEFLNLKYKKIVKIITDTAKNYTSSFSLMPIISVIILSALIKNFRTSIESRINLEVIDAVSMICICIGVINPMAKLINEASAIITSASNFEICIAPILSGIMLASGQASSATSYATVVLAVGQIISYISANFLIPFMNMLLGISLISCISSRLHIENLCLSIQKWIKTALKISASSFTGILTVQNLIGSSADSLGKSTIKLTIDSCVPIVGGAISDAVSTMSECLKLLKTSVGSFGIIAGIIIFLPVIIKCFFWIISLNVCSVIADIFELEKISCLIKSASNVISTLLAITACVILILIVSTGIVLVVGR